MGPSGCGKTSFLDIIGGVGGSGSGKLSGQLLVNDKALDHQELRKVLLLLNIFFLFPFRTLILCYMFFIYFNIGFSSRSTR